MRRLAGVCALVAAAAAAQASAAEQPELHTYSIPWQRSYVNPERPKVIKIAYEASSSQFLDHASVHFHHDRVSVTIWVSSSDQVLTNMVLRCASVRMGERLRGRRRFDGHTHRRPPRQKGPWWHSFKLKRAKCPRPKVDRHHLE